MHEGGLEPGARPNYYYFTVPAPCSTTTHGDQCLYDSAVIPPTDSDGWVSAPDPNIIAFTRNSYVSCFREVDYTYFQTFVHVPVGDTVSSLTINMGTIDDGARITIYNSIFPNGVVVPGSYVMPGQTSSSNDLSSLMTDGVNRIVITQLDDCASGNNLRSAVVVLDGSNVGGTC